jgi:hypothetical protein
LILPEIGHGKGRVPQGHLVQQELPESGCQVDNGKDHTHSSANVTDTFSKILHGVFVGKGVGIESTEILH